MQRKKEQNHDFKRSPAKKLKQTEDTKISADLLQREQALAAVETDQAQVKQSGGSHRSAHELFRMLKICLTISLFKIYIFLVSFIKNNRMK